MAKEKWSDDETSSLIAYWEEHFEDYKRHKTPFYEAAALSIGTKSGKSVKNRCEHLERKYIAIKEKISASGFGVRDEDPPTLRATITKELKCGTRPSAILSTIQQEVEYLLNEHDSAATSMSETLASDATVSATTKPTTINVNKRKAGYSITEVLLSLGERGLELERGRLELKQRQFEYEML
ncbi:hypothetical protein LEN26_005221 [Aphanomyces euteiches]|nr:hypothetical protein AeMF1_012736 [Aphanomyces euteiches]KAH9121374.1 hypothetical protein LEN26_010706 [Aphanomyces euteiches]KAH9141560.1 hypothetical protein LEN26_005221 [Aphanomyces euteiches]